MVAAEAGNLEIVKYLVSQGADLDVEDVNRNPAIRLAALTNHKEVAEYLLSVGAKPEFLTSVILGDTNEVAKVLKRYRGLADPRVVRIDKPILLAARNDHLEVMRLLLVHGADVNSRTKKGDLIIHLSARRGRLDQVKLLLEFGAEIEARNVRLETPLHLAAEFAEIELVKLLLENGADPSAKDWQRRTPFHRAIRGNRMDTIRLLIDTVKDIDDMSEEGTALHLAVWTHGNVEVVKLLLAQNADVHLRDRRRNTPLKLARQFRRTQIAALLEEAGAFQ